MKIHPIRVYFCFVEIKFSEMRSFVNKIPVLLLPLSMMLFVSGSLGAQELIWHVKAMHPEGYTLDVKAFDEEGAYFDVKALEEAEQSYIMDVKAFVKGERLPVKVLVSEEEYKPLAAIDSEGKTYVLRAITKEGVYLPVKGVRKSGYIVHVKAVNENGDFYGVKAISTEGKLRDVKGVKMYDKRSEVTLNGVQVHAHVVALPQIQ